MRLLAPFMKGPIPSSTVRSITAGIRRGPRASDSREMPDIESSTDSYARRFRGSVGRAFLDRQAESMRRLLASLPMPSSILDVGGGHAQIAPDLARAGHVVTVLGSDVSCADRSRPLIDAGDLRFVVGDLLRLPAADRSVDLVLSIRLLGHMREWQGLIAELCRVARRSVIIDFASTHSLNALAKSLFSAKLKIEGNTRAFTVFDPRDIEECLLANGFAVRAIEPQFVLPMALYRLVRLRLLLSVCERPLRAAGITQRFGSPLIVRADRVDTST